MAAAAGSLDPKALTVLGADTEPLLHAIKIGAGTEPPAHLPQFWVDLRSENPPVRAGLIAKPESQGVQAWPQQQHAAALVGS